MTDIGTYLLIGLITLLIMGLPDGETSSSPKLSVISAIGIVVTMVPVLIIGSKL